MADIRTRNLTKDGSSHTGKNRWIPRRQSGLASRAVAKRVFNSPHLHILR